MTESRRLSDLVGRVSLHDLQSYLARKGWQRIPSDQKRWEVFRTTTPSKQAFELILPRSDSFVDARSRMAAAISALSQIQEKSIDAISKEIVESDSDAFIVRVELGKDVGSIPLNEAAKQIKAIKNFLLFGTCSELEVRPHFDQALPAAAALLGGFEFCHTFEGSFGFEVASPVPTPGVSMDMFNSPTRRRVMERIARGLSVLDDAVKTESPNLIVDSYSTAFNARMCDALVEIGGTEEAPFEVEIEWATMFKPAEDVIAAKPRRIGEIQVSMLKFAAEQLKLVEPHARVVRGQVINLHCTRNPAEGAAKRTIAIKTQDQERGWIEVRMSLGSEFYAIAIDAHSKGLPVEATGQLQRRGNTWSMEVVSRFYIVEERSADH